MKFRDLVDAIDDFRKFHGDSDELMNLDVYVEYDYGDHCRTRALASPDSVDLVIPEKTAYSATELCVPRRGGFTGLITDDTCLVIGRGER